MSGSIYYFLIADKSSQKEIGTFVDNSGGGNTINDFNTIVAKSKEILHSSEEGLAISRNKKNKISLDNHNIFYIITLTNTFYLAAVKKNSKFSEQENLIFELIEDIDHQGIKKLVDKNGELTNVGRQNLKFSIDKYQEATLLRTNASNEKESVGNGSNNTGINTSGEVDKIQSVTSQVNEIKTDMKQGMKLMMGNMNEMSELENKAMRIKDASLKFKQDSRNLEGRMRWQNMKFKILMISLLLIIAGIITYFIFG